MNEYFKKKNQISAEPMEMEELLSIQDTEDQGILSGKSSGGLKPLSGALPDNAGAGAESVGKKGKSQTRRDNEIRWEKMKPESVKLTRNKQKISIKIKG